MENEPLQVTPSWGNDKWSDPDAGSQRNAESGSDAPTCSEFAGIQALIRIREGLGDPYGKLMQDELVEKVLNLVQGEKELREGVIKYIKDREEDGEDECVDELKFLLDYTQWWDWDIDTQNAEAIRPATKTTNETNQ